MPNAVKLLASTDPKLNLSDEVYAAFKEPGGSIAVSVVTGNISVQRQALAFARPKAAISTGAKVEQELDKEEALEMLGHPDDWKLAIPNGSSTDVLTKDALRRAWDSDATDTVTRTLRAATLDEQAALEDAKERLSPKAGTARYAAAVGAPVTNIALLATAAGGFLAIKSEDKLARPSLAFIASVLALSALVLSIVGTALLHGETIKLARLDLLQQPLKPRFSLPNACVLLFLAALVCAPFSVFPKDSSSASPAASFGAITLMETAKETRATFKVTWKNLSQEVSAVRSTVTAASGESVSVSTAKEDATVTQHLADTVKIPTTILVSTQQLDKDRAPLGDLITHTYSVKASG
jgi:hypothetical protein